MGRKRSQPALLVGVSLELSVEPVYEKQPGEPNDWYYRFHSHYLLQGPGRTITEAVRRELAEAKPGVNIRTQTSRTNVGTPRSQRDQKKFNTDVENRRSQWSRMASQYRWDERASAWDMDQNKQLHRLYCDRRRKIIQEALDDRDGYVELSKRLQARATEILNTPLYEVEKRVPDPNEPGRLVTVVMRPASWGQRDGASLAVASMNLRNGADQLVFGSGMITEDDIEKAIFAMVEAGMAPEQVQEIFVNSVFDVKAKIREAFSSRQSVLPAIAGSAA